MLCKHLIPTVCLVLYYVQLNNGWMHLDHNIIIQNSMLLKGGASRKQPKFIFSKFNWWQDETMNLLLAICRKVNFEHIWLREKQSVIVTYRQNLFSPAILTSLTIKTSEDWHQDMVNHWVFLTDDHSRTRTRQPATYIFHANNKFTTSAKQNHQDTRLFTSYWVQIKSSPTDHLMQLPFSTIAYRS